MLTDLGTRRSPLRGGPRSSSAMVRNLYFGLCAYLHDRSTSAIENTELEVSTGASLCAGVGRPPHRQKLSFIRRRDRLEHVLESITHKKSTMGNNSRKRINGLRLQTPKLSFFRHCSSRFGHDRMLRLATVSVATQFPRVRYSILIVVTPLCVSVSLCRGGVVTTSAQVLCSSCSPLSFPVSETVFE